MIENNLQIKRNNLVSLKEKIKNADSLQVMQALLFMYLYLTNVANHTIFSVISIALICLYTLYYIYKKQDYHFNKYFAFAALFIGYQLILLFLETVRSMNIVVNTLKTMGANIVILFVIYNIIMEMKDMKKISKIYVYAAVISLITIIIALNGDVFSGRLGHAYGKNSVSYYFIGAPVAITSNYIALFCSIAALLSMYIYHEEKGGEYLIYTMFCIFGVFLTGSRKGILLLVVFAICVMNMFIKGKTSLKIAIIGSLSLMGFIAITKIPFLYNIIGERLIALITHIFGKSTEEGSIVARERYQGYAFKWISEHPILGQGVGTFKRVYKNNTESNYLEILVSGGIIGLVLYYYYLAKAFIKELIKKNKDDFSKMMIYIIAAVFIAEIGTVTYLSRPYLILWILFFANIQLKSNKKDIIKMPKVVYDIVNRIRNKIFYELENIGLYNRTSDEDYLKKAYEIKVGKELDLNNPQSFNEKIQWLKIHDRNPSYTNLVDKYEVKKYIEEKIGSEYIIPSIGVYDNFDDIDFTKLPNQFVIKCTHDSGGLVVVKDKTKFDYKKAKKKINKSLKRNYYWRTREWPYKDIKPRIIIEEYMEDKKYHELVDYKILCFDGKAKILFTCSERFSEDGLKVTFFDMDWNKLPFERKYKSSKKDIEKPLNYDKMVELSEKLSKDLKFVRVDWYEINGKLYFGELTFYPGSGFEKFYPEEWDYKIGKWIELDTDKK